MTTGASPSGTTATADRSPAFYGPIEFLADRWDARDRVLEVADACPCCGVPATDCNVRRLPARLRLITTCSDPKGTPRAS